ncbi:KRAB-A domain-containing protein [Aphelenchoides avenae]|nr:KRAB-A domain-containing protein [Aphelenchus avenae]
MPYEANKEKNATSTTCTDSIQGQIYSMRSARPSLEVVMKVNGHEEACLFDTGCNVTYISRDILPLVGSPQLQPSRLPTARTANGGIVGFEASVELPIQLRNRAVNHRFHVTAPQNCPSKIVIGTDAMKKLAVNRRIVIDLEEAQILLDDEAVDMVQPLAFINALVQEMEQQADEQPLIARVAAEVVIPPRGDYHLEAHVEGTINPEAYYITEERPHEYHAKVGKICIKAPTDEKKTVPIRVLNMSTAPVKIHKGARIATLCEVTPMEQQPKEDRRKRTRHHSEDEPIDPHYVPKEADLEDLFEHPQEDWEEQIRKLDLSKSLFNDEQQRQMRYILRKRHRAFVQKDGRIGCYLGNILHRIEVKPGTKPARRRAIRLPLNQQKEILRQLKDLLDKGLIQPSDSPYAAPVLLVRKRNGEYRFVCDYRGLNQSLADQCFVLPNIQTLIDTCAGQKIFTTVDFAQGYMQTRVAPEDVHKTAFITEFGLFEWLVTPFGMRHSGETFNKLMRKVAEQVSFRLMAFVDDVILCSESIPRHLQQIDEFLCVIESNHLTLKLAKCIFGQDRVKHLGVLISGDGYEMDPEKVAAILEQQPPTTITDLRKFIGVINYFRRHIADCAALLGPLYELLSAERIEWTPRHQEAFDEVKRRVTSAPVLGSFRTGEPCVLEVDASKAGFGGCILQKDLEGTLRPIAFVSRRTNKHEKNYHATELEACGIAWILTKAAPYIIGAPQSLVRTDNAACVALLTKNDESLTSRMNKYRLAIQGYNVKIEHRSGKSNVVADYLSRYHFDNAEAPSAKRVKEDTTEAGATTPRSADATEPIATGATEPSATGATIPSATGTPEEGTINAILTEDLRLTLPRIQAEQKRDAFTKPIYDALAYKRFPQNPESLRKVQRLMGKYAVKQNTLYFIKPSHIEPRIVLPARYQEAAVRELHEDPLEGGHLGTFKTLEKLRARFYWPKMADYVNQIIAGCDICQKRKTPPHLVSTEPLAAWPAARWPTDRYHIDLMGPLPLSQRRFRYVLTATDALTKWITAIPLRNQTAEEVKNAFEKEVICHFGVPTYVISDCGSNLLSKQFAELAEVYSFKHITISPYHQQSNGQAERSHSTLANMIAAYANDNGSNWCSLLAPTTFAYNCSIHRVTGRSPFQMLYGREPCLPIDLRTKLFPEEQIEESGDGGRSCEEVQRATESAREQQSETMEQLREAWKLVREAIEEKTAVRDAYRDEKIGAKQHEFREGELVLRKLAHERMHHKFAARYEGPYKIVSIQKPNAFIQKLHEEATPTKVHFDLLKPFKESVALPLYATEEGPEEIEGTIAIVEGSRGKADDEQRTTIATAKKAGIMALRDAASQSYRPVTEELLKVYEELVVVNIHTDEKMFEEPRSNLEAYVAVNINIIAREMDTPEQTEQQGATDQTEQQGATEQSAQQSATKPVEQPTIAVCNGTAAFSEEAYYRKYCKESSTKPNEEQMIERAHQENTGEDEERISEEEDQSWSNISSDEGQELSDENSARTKERQNEEPAKKATDIARPECRSQADECCNIGAGRPECRGQAEEYRIRTGPINGDVQTRQWTIEVGRPEHRGQADESRNITDLHPPGQGNSRISNRRAEVFLTREDAGTAQHHHYTRDTELCRQSADVNTCDARSFDDHSNNAKDDPTNNASIGEKVDDDRTES